MMRGEQGTAEEDLLCQRRQDYGCNQKGDRRNPVPLFFMKDHA